MLNARLSRSPATFGLCAPLLACLATGCLVEHRPESGANKSNASNTRAPAGSISSADVDGQNSGSATSSSTNENGNDASSKGNPSAEGGENADGGNCEDERDSVCLPSAPKEWLGPVQPQSTNDVGKLVPCPVGLNPQDFWKQQESQQATRTPDSSRNIFVDDIDAPPAKCTGCETKLDLGTCAPPKYVVRTVGPTGDESCGTVVEGFRPLHLGPECHTIDFDPDQLAPDQALSAIPARPRKEEVGCTIGKDGVEELPPAIAQNYYRICQGQPKEASCDSADASCLRFQQRHQAPHSPVACVYRRGDHTCPANQPYTKRTLIYGAIRDDRNCGKCEAKHEIGEVDCGYSIFLSSLDTNRDCAAPEIIRPEALCLSAQHLRQARASKSPFSISGTFSAITYSGSCKAAPSWGPRGQASKAEPFTLCCTPMN